MITIIINMFGDTVVLQMQDEMQTAGYIEMLNNVGFVNMPYKRAFFRLSEGQFAVVR